MPLLSSPRTIKSFLPFVIVGVIAPLAIATGAILYRAKRMPPLIVSKEQAAPAQNFDSVHARGSANAPVTLEEFGDFQCPPCGGLAGPLLQIERDYRPRLCVIFRNFPFTIHEHAYEAAFAAEAAGLQGRSWEMHDLLYREQAAWSKAREVQPLFNAYAEMLGLNIERFARDMASEQVKARVASDRKRGESLGVRTTPSIFINNRSVSPTSLNPAGLRAAIDAAIQGKANGS